MKNEHKEAKELAEKLNMLSHAKQRYNEWAKNYDRDLLNYMGYDAPRKVAEKFLPYLKRGQSILELGCGTGLNSQFYWKKNCVMTGVDISKKCLDIAIKKGGYRYLYLGDIESVMTNYFKDKEFDAVLCVGVFEYFKKLDFVIKEMGRVVKPKGHVTFTIPSTAATGLYNHNIREAKNNIKENNLEILGLFRFKAYVEGRKTGNLDIFNWAFICQPKKNGNKLNNLK